MRATPEQLAESRSWAGMTGFSVGCVWCKVMAGSFAMVDIVLTAEGWLIAKPRLNMRD